MARQVIFQTTGNHTATPASPDLVTAGTIACFNSATGAVSAMNGAAPAEFFLVQGHADYPILTPSMVKADFKSVEKQLYVAPVKQRVTVASVPAGPTGGAEFSLKVVELANPVERRGGVEPRYRKNYNITVPVSQTDEDSIYAFAALINADSRRIVNAGSNKSATGVIGTTSGTLGVTVADPTSGRSVTYTEAYDTSLAVTGAAFVTSHAAAILAAFGIVVTFDTVTLTFTGGINTNFNGGADWTVVDDASGGCTMAAATYTEATTLLLEAKEQGTQFEVKKNEDIDAAVVTTSVAHVEGSGSPQQVLRMEQDAMGAYGNYYRETPQPLLPATYSGSSNFDIYTIRMKSDQDGQMPVKGHQFEEIVLCIVDGLSGDLDTFFGL